MTVSPEQAALESWWNEDPEMRHAEILCGENLRVCVRLFQIDIQRGEEQIAGFEAGTLLEAINGAVARTTEPRDPAGWESGFADNH